MQMCFLKVFLVAVTIKCWRTQSSLCGQITEVRKASAVTLFLKLLFVFLSVLQDGGRFTSK